MSAAKGPPRHPRRLSALAALAATLLVAACASRGPTAAAPAAPGIEPAAAPAPAESAPDRGTVAAADRLYAELEAGLQEFAAAVELLLTGQQEVADEKLASATGAINRATAECARIPGVCDLDRFLNAYSELIHVQASALKGQTSALEPIVLDQEIEREPGTSPFIGAMPALGRSVNLLRGTELAELIQLNGPVNAALDDWLTWMRPDLMEAYHNYLFLRSRVAPIYEQAGLPEALLFAMIATESKGKVHSYSRAGAAGPLQFMSYTGRRYGLREVDGFDLRLDPEASTRANVAYLNEHFELFNNSLEKVLAAYNGGESRMKSLERRYREASFWDRTVYYSFPRETREYVPRVLAAAWLFLHPEDYNLEFPSPDTATVRMGIRQPISLSELTVCLGQAHNPDGWFRTLRNLNPRLDPGERVRAGAEIEIPAILVPVYEERCLESDLLARARQLHDANYPELPVMIPYTVRSGDTLNQIAARFPCASLREIAELNRIRPPSFLIRVGQQLKIPTCGG